MKQTHGHSMISIAILMLCVFISSPALSSDNSDNPTQSEPDQVTSTQSENNNLDQARSFLGYAFDSYKKGDIDATKNNLQQASKWLAKAAENSKADKSKEESQKLAAEINQLKETISQSSDNHENSLARFWHRVTSIIKREADQLTHSYVTLSIDEKTLKHLLDAKMHLFTAEHDLFVSHETKDAEYELEKTIEYLKDAKEVAKPVTSDKVAALLADIQGLKDNINSKKDIWRKDSMIQSLDKAIGNLDDAREKASPTTKLRIDLLKTEVLAVREHVEQGNLKTNYDDAMTTLQTIINEL